jgi:hypothetical protein
LGRELGASRHYCVDWDCSGGGLWTNETYGPGKREVEKASIREGKAKKPKIN